MLWAVDTETTGLNRFKGARPFLYLAYNGVEYIVTKNKDDIKDIVENPANECVFHNAKFDIHMLRAVGVSVRAKVYDTLIAAHLLDENRRSKALKSLAKTVLHQDTDGEERISEWFKNKKIKKADRDYTQLPDDLIIPYGKQDVYFTFELFKNFKPKLEQEALMPIFNMECALIHVLVEMEEHGVLIDKTKTIELNKKLLLEIEKVKTSISSLFGDDFVFTSNKQLGDKLQSIGVEVSYTSKGNVCVNAAALKTYDNRLCQLVFEYRKLEKLQNTYCDSLLGLLDQKDTIHANFMSWSTKTGRFSCAEPNLQNIPRPDENKPETKWIRSLFIPRDGFTNFYIDYEQIEYRVAAEYFNDPTLIDRINQGEDVHTLQAQRIFGTHDITKEQRSLAKCVNFAVLYGAGVETLSQITGKDKETAQALFKKFHSENRSIYDIKKRMSILLAGEYRAFGRTIKCGQQKRGFIFNRFGRKYRIPENQWYKGFNYICQGTAADIIKFAMVDVHKYLNNKKSNLLLNVHDELCIEVFKGEEYVLTEIKRLMENFTHLFKVKILTDISYTTTNWANKKKYERNTV